MQSALPPTTVFVIVSDPPLLTDRSPSTDAASRLEVAPFGTEDPGDDRAGHRAGAVHHRRPRGRGRPVGERHRADVAGEHRRREVGPDRTFAVIPPLPVAPWKTPVDRLPSMLHVPQSCRVRGGVRTPPSGLNGLSECSVVDQGHDAAVRRRARPLAGDVEQHAVGPDVHAGAELRRPAGPGECTRAAFLGRTDGRVEGTERPGGGAASLDQQCPRWLPGSRPSPGSSARSRTWRGSPPASAGHPARRPRSDRPIPLSQ